MTSAKRIVLNVFATYSRSLLALLCGLFVSRWVIEALGVEAYGVFGVIGALVGICSTINGMISGSVGRFYAYAFGEAKANLDKDAALENCRCWFNVAVFLHLICPLLLCGIGYVVGSWAIENYFNIPEQYRESSHVVLLFSVCGMFVAMVTAPFKAMYVAQQYIAELTIYSFLNPILTLICSWCLLHYKGDRLVFRAAYMMVIGLLPNVIITCRAMFVFPECKICMSKMVDLKKIRQLLSFAGWQFVGLTGLTMRDQGLPILVNKMLGVNFNSTMSVASTVSGHAGTLSASVNNAFYPAITNAAGAGDRELFYKLSLRTSKFGTLLFALFAIPLAVEINFIVQLWLKTVPPFVSVMCLAMMGYIVLDRCGMGALMAVNAQGQVRCHEIWCFIFHLMTLALSFVFLKFFGFGILGIGYGLITGTLAILVMRMTLWKIQLGFPVRPWLLGFLCPFIVSGFIAYGVGIWLRGCFSPSIVRVLLASGGAFTVFSVLSYVLVFDAEERTTVRGFISRKILHKS